MNIGLLMEYLVGLISQVYPDVWERPGEKFKKPYITYSLTSLDGNPEENFFLNLEIWGDNTDTTQIDTIWSDLNNALDGHTGVTDAFGVLIYRNTRGMREDANPRIRLRYIVFDVTVWFIE